MLEFWLLASLFVLTSLAVILKTILGRHKSDSAYHENDVTIYHQRLSELESDMANGTLDEAEATIAKKEIELSLLNHNKTNNTLSSTSFLPESKSKWITAVMLSLLIPVFVFILYNHLGQPDSITQAELLADFHNAMSDDEKQVSIEKMLIRVEQRLLDEPDDIDAWYMLANSYKTLKHYPDAVRAFENLHRLIGDEPSLLVHYADTLIMANSGVIAGKPVELINKALKLEPDNMTGLWLAGLAANERGDISEAVNYWQRLIPKLEEGSETQQSIKQYIQIASQHIENGQDEVLSDTIEKGHRLQVNISLSADLSNEINIEDTVFIYAKAIDGSKMPLVILRKKVSDLPLLATMDDSMSMLPSRKLSDYENVQVIARISASGNAKAQTGDFIGSIDTVKTNLKEPVNLVINNKIQ